MTPGQKYKQYVSELYEAHVAGLLVYEPDPVPVDLGPSKRKRQADQQRRLADQLWIHYYECIVDHEYGQAAETLMMLATFETDGSAGSFLDVAYQPDVAQELYRIYKNPFPLPNLYPVRHVWELRTPHYFWTITMEESPLEQQAADVQLPPGTTQLPIEVDGVIGTMTVRI